MVPTYTVGFTAKYSICNAFNSVNTFHSDDGVNLLSVGKDERTPNETGSVLEPPTSYPFYQNASNVADLLADGQSFSDCESFECDAHPLFICCGYELIPRVLPLYL